MLENPITMPEFKDKKMKHEKKHKSAKHHESKGAPEILHKMGMIQPMAHGKGAQHLKPMKKGHKDASGK